MSDNELDAELLALAGGDESSDEEAQDTSQSKPAVRSRSASDDDAPASKRSNHQKLQSRGAAKRARRDDSEEEEGEASDYGSPAPIVEEENPYPVEGKFRSSRERAEIMAMTEMEREQILADRAAEIDRRNQDLKLKRLLAGSDDKKRKAGMAELEDGARKSHRQKTKTTERLDAYKRQRELKGAQRARGEGARRGDRSPSEDGQRSDDVDADGESEVEWDDHKPQTSPQRDEGPPGLELFNKVRLGRLELAQYCCYPRFEDTVKGCYCLVSVGSEGSKAYRMAEIRGVKQGRPYQFLNRENKQIPTDQMLTVSYGKTERDFQFSMISTTRDARSGKIMGFSDADLAQFTTMVKSDDNKLRMPSRRQLQSKIDDLDENLVRLQWTDALIQQRLDRTAEMRKKLQNMMRDRIVRRRTDAESRGDELVVARCDQELADFDGGVKPASQSKAEVVDTKDMSQQERLAALNRERRNKNAQEVREAQLAEKRAAQKVRDARARLRAEDAEKIRASQSSGAEEDGDDLFGEEDAIGTPAKVKREQRSVTPSGIKREKSIGGLRKKNMDDDFIASMDLGIEIDI